MLYSVLVHHFSFWLSHLFRLCCSKAPPHANMVLPSLRFHGQDGLVKPRTLHIFPHVVVKASPGFVAVGCTFFSPIYQIVVDMLRWNLSSDILQLPCYDDFGLILEEHGDLCQCNVASIDFWLKAFYAQNISFLFITCHLCKRDQISIDFSC